MEDVVIYMIGLASIIVTISALWYLFQTVRIMWGYSSLLAIAAVIFSPFVHIAFYFMPKDELNDQENSAFKRYFIAIGAMVFIGIIASVVIPSLLEKTKVVYVPQQDDTSSPYLENYGDDNNEVDGFADAYAQESDTWLQEQIAEDEIRRQEIARFVAENRAPQSEAEQSSLLDEYDVQDTDYGSRYDYQNTLLETSPTESMVRAPTYYTPSNDQPSQYSAPIINNTAPSAIVNCDGAGCWGTDGTRYNKGAGETYFPSTGGVCQNIGGQMQCN